MKNSTGTFAQPEKGNSSLLKSFRDARPWNVSENYRQRQSAPSSPSKANFNDLMPANFDRRLLGNLPKLDLKPIAASGPKVKAVAEEKDVVDVIVAKKGALISPLRLSTDSGKPQQQAEFSKMLAATMAEYVLLDSDIRDDGLNDLVVAKSMMPWTNSDAMQKQESYQKSLAEQGTRRYMAGTAANSLGLTDRSRRKIHKTFAQQRDENGAVTFETKHLVVREIPSVDTKKSLKVSNFAPEVESKFSKQLEDVLTILTDPNPALNIGVLAPTLNDAAYSEQYANKVEQIQCALQLLLDWIRQPPNAPLNTARGICLTLFDLGAVPVLLKCISELKDNSQVVALASKVLLHLESYQKLTSSSIAQCGGTSLLLYLLSREPKACTGSATLSAISDLQRSEHESLQEDSAVSSGKSAPAEALEPALPASESPRDRIVAAEQHKPFQRTHSFKSSPIPGFPTVARRRSLSIISPSQSQQFSGGLTGGPLGFELPKTLEGAYTSNSVQHSATNLLNSEVSSLASSSASDLNDSSIPPSNPFNFTPIKVAPMYDGMGGTYQFPPLGTPSTGSPQSNGVGATPQNSPSRFNFRRLSLNHSSSAVFSNTELPVSATAEKGGQSAEPLEAGQSLNSASTTNLLPNFSSLQASSPGLGQIMSQPPYLMKRRLSFQKNQLMRAPGSGQNENAEQASASLPNAGFPTITKVNSTPVVNLGFSQYAPGVIETVPRSQLELQFNKMKWVLSKLESLLIVDGRMFFSSDPHGVIGSIMNDAKTLVEAEAIFITLIDPANEELIAYESIKRFTTSAPDKNADGSVDSSSNERQLWSDTIAFTDRSVAKFPPGQGIVGHVAKTRTLLNVPLVVDCQWFNNEIDCRSSTVFAQSILCIPMIKDNVLHGCLSVVNKVLKSSTRDSGSGGLQDNSSSSSLPDQSPLSSFPQRRHSISYTAKLSVGNSSADHNSGHFGMQKTSSQNGSWHKLNVMQKVGAFNDEDEGLLNLLADRIVVTMVNAKKKDDLGHVQERIDLLLRNTHNMASSLYNTKDLARMVMQAAKEMVQADSCVLVIRDNSLKQNIMYMPTKHGLAELRINDDAGIFTHVIKGNHTLQINDVSKDARYNVEFDKTYGYNTQSLLAVPLTSSTTQRAFGCVMVRNKIKEIKFNDDDVKMLSGFCAQAAMTFEKLNHVKELDEVHSFMKRVLESIQATVIVVDENSFLMSCNKTWLWESVGLSREEYVQRPITYYLKDYPLLLQDLLHCQKTGTNAYQPSFPFEIKSRSGSRVMHLKYSMNPLKTASNDDGGANMENKNRSVVIVLEDLTSEKRALDTLGRYMDPLLVKEVMSEHGNELGGVRRKIAILFSDIRSFTTLAESLEPQQVVKLLNEHFEDSVDAILSEHGILDKFIGDAVMAVFGVPFSSDKDSVNACNAALKMLDALKVANRRREANGQKVIHIGIGINTGEVLSGNIGSTKRMEYSCIGDAVNLSSRLESLTKHYHSTLLFTEFTREELDDQFIIREVDKVQVVGKKRGVAIFDILGKSSSCSPVEYNSKMQLIEKYGQALAAYRQGNFSDAKQMFLKCATLFNRDGPSVTMHERCALYEKEPPNLDDWKGVFVPDFK